MNLIPSLLLINRWHKQLWLWPSSFCTHNHPKTFSFRATTTDHPNYHLLFNNYKQDRHQLLLQPPEVVEQLATLGSCYTTQYSSESACIINSTEDSGEYDDFETIVRGASWSERLFFEPDPTSSIVFDETQSRGQGSSSTTSQCASSLSTDENINGGGLAYYKERTSSTVAMVMESENPYVDFKKSMAEMVEIHDDLLKDWDCLEELLGWYLRMNGKNNHHFIFEAFVDLLIAGFSNTSDGVSCLDHRSKASFTTSAASTFSSPISSPALSHGDN